MKHILTVLLISVLATVLILPCSADADPVPAGNKVRFDVTEEEFLRMGETLFAKVEEDSDELNHLKSFPVLPEAMLRLGDEFRNNSSVLELREDGYVKWFTEAAKTVYDERLLGVNVWAEFGSEDSRLEIPETNIDGKKGLVCFELPAGYSPEQISSLRILYEPSEGGQFNFGNARFDLTYTVSDGKVFCGSVEVILEYYGYCMEWYMSGSEDSGGPVLSCLFENLQNDTSWNGSFNMLTGELKERY